MDRLVPPALLRAYLGRPRSLGLPSGRRVQGDQAFPASLGIPSVPARRQSPGRRLVPEVPACPEVPCTLVRVCPEGPAGRQSAQTACLSRLRRRSRAGLLRCIRGQVCQLSPAFLVSPALLANLVCRGLLRRQVGPTFLALLLDRALQMLLFPQGVQSFPCLLACLVVLVVRRFVLMAVAP